MITDLAGRAASQWLAGDNLYDAHVSREGARRRDRSRAPEDDVT